MRVLGALDAPGATMRKTRHLTIMSSADGPMLYTRNENTTIHDVGPLPAHTLTHRLQGTTKGNTSSYRASISLDMPKEDRTSINSSKSALHALKFKPGFTHINGESLPNEKANTSSGQREGGKNRGLYGEGDKSLVERRMQQAIMQKSREKGRVRPHSTY